MRKYWAQMEGDESIDQVPGEKYAVNDRIKVYVKRSGLQPGSQVMVSRSNAGFVKRLFEIEVPEIKSGLVKIKNIVRKDTVQNERLYRGPQPDAIGACIGAKGVRVNIVSELSGERWT